MDNSPDVNTGVPAQPQAAPAPAAEPSPATPEKLQVPHRDSEAYAKWRQTGELPEPKETKPPSKRETSAPSQPSAEAETPAEEAAPEAAKLEQRRNGASDRLQEILSDLKRAGLTPSELKTYRREAAQAKPPETTVQPPQPQQPPQELKPPKLEDYKTWEEFRAAELDYTRALVREEFRQQLAVQAQEQARQAAGQKLMDAAQRYGPEASETITSTAQSVFNDNQVHPAIKGILNDSPVIADLLYVMGSNGNDFQAFLEMARRDPGQAIRNAVLLERLVIEELRKQPAPAAAEGNQEPPPAEQPERDESGRFVKAQAPAKRTTEAPPPTREVSGRASPPLDDVDAAFARNDVRGYFQAANRRDLAERKGR